MSKELVKEGAGSSKKDSKKTSEEVLLPEPIKALIEKSGVSKDEKQRIAVQIASYFRGPLPPPEILSAYNQIVEGGAERIFQKFEHQSEHRMELESFAVKEEIKQSGRGQIFGFIIAIFGLALAGLMAYLGHDNFAMVLGGGTIVSLATVFVVGKFNQRAQIKNK